MIILLKKRFFKPLVIFLAVIIASFAFSVSASAASSPVHTANSLDDFLKLEDFSTLGGETLSLNWWTDYSDSIPVPYIHCEGIGKTLTGKDLVLNTSFFGPTLIDNTDYQVHLPIQFLVVGGVGYYPSSSFSLEIRYTDSNGSVKVLTVSGSDYRFTNANRGHFYCTFDFVIPGSILNTDPIFRFIGYRSVARTTPVRMSLASDFTISVYNPSSDAADLIIDNNNHNTDRIIENYNNSQDELLNGWSGGSLDGSSLEDSEDLQAGVLDSEAKMIVGFDSSGNPVYQEGSVSDLAKHHLGNTFTSVIDYFQNNKAIAAVTNFLTKLMNVNGLRILFTFSLGVAVIPLIVGLGINAGRGSDRRAAREAARTAQNSRQRRK